MKIKPGWGTKIALLYIGFVIMIITLVVSTTFQKFELVAEDYYQQELTYQEVIDASQNQSLLSAPVRFVREKNRIVIVFPLEFTDKDLTGSAHFYAPANAAYDQEYPLRLSGNKMMISTDDLVKTTYKIKLSWQSGGKAYYQEQEIRF